MYLGELVEVLRGGISSKLVPGGLGYNLQRKAFTIHSAISKSRTHSPSVYLHLIADKEEGFRTVLWLPVNANRTPVELISPFSMH